MFYLGSCLVRVPTLVGVCVLGFVVVTCVEYVRVDCCLCLSLIARFCLKLFLFDASLVTFDLVTWVGFAATFCFGIDYVVYVYG